MKVNCFHQDKTMEKKKKKNHGQDPKRLVLAVLILIAVIFMLIGPRAKAEVPALEATQYLVEQNVPIMPLIQSMIFG